MTESAYKSEITRQTVKQNNKEICLTSLCMCVHQLVREYDYILQCVIVISK